MGIDTELLLQDPKRPVALPIELGGRVVVFEDETLAGAGLVLGQGGSLSGPLYRGSRIAAPSLEASR